MTNEQPPVTFPAWAQKVGVGFGALTFAFLVFLVIWSMNGVGVPDSSRFLVVAILALGVAFSMAFLGGSAAAKGNIPIPGVAAHPISFSIAGGVATFIVVLLVGYFAYVNQVAGGTSTTIGFEATPPGPFAVRATIRGEVVVDDRTLTVRVTDAILSMPKAPPAGRSQYIDSLSAVLASSDGEGGWKEVQRSTFSVKVAQELSEGEEIKLKAFTLRIERSGLALQERWLVFDVRISQSATDPAVGSAYSRTADTLFSTVSH